MPPLFAYTTGRMKSVFRDKTLYGSLHLTLSFPLSWRSRLPTCCISPLTSAQIVTLSGISSAFGTRLTPKISAYPSTHSNRPLLGGASRLCPGKAPAFPGAKEGGQRPTDDFLRRGQGGRCMAWRGPQP